MRYLIVALLLSLTFTPAPARADDEPGLSDGGSIVGGSSGGFDGGRNAVAVLQTSITRWRMAITCEGAQSTRYELTADGGLAHAASQPLPYSTETEIHTVEVNVNEPIPGVPGAFPKKSYIALRTDDGGVPYCLVKLTH